MKPFRQFFENLALTWDEAQPMDREQTIHNLLSLFDKNIRQHHEILELGTGTGALIPILGNRYPSARITSIDIAHNMLTRAKSRVADARLTQSDVHQLPFLHNSFDLIICHNCFPHFCQQSIALLEIHRVLNPQGELFILHDISREHVNSVHQKAQNAIIHDHTLPEVPIITAKLKRYGFEIISLDDTADHFIIYAKLY